MSDAKGLMEQFQDREWGAAQLSEVSLFGSFSEPELRELYGVGRLVRLRSKTHVVVEGEPTRGLYILLHGTVSVYKSDPATDKMIRLTMLDEGASFGEMSLFDTAPRSATVVAESTCYLFQLDADRFQEYLADQGNALELRFYRVCAEYLAERFRSLNSDYLESQKLLWQHALRRSDEEEAS